MCYIYWTNDTLLNSNNREDFLLPRSYIPRTFTFFGEIYVTSERYSALLLVILELRVKVIHFLITCFCIKSTTNILVKSLCSYFGGNVMLSFVVGV